MGNDSFEAEIEKLATEVKDLAAKRDKLRLKFEASQREMAHYSYLIEQKESLEREIAQLEGRNDDENSGDEL